MSDRAEPRPVASGFLGRIGQGVTRLLHEIAQRLIAALGLIVAVGVILASLVVIGGLSKTFALIGFFSFVASAMLLPRHDSDHALPAKLEPATPSVPLLAAMPALA